MALDRNSFLALSRPLEVKEFFCHALGGSVYLKEMSAGERDRLESEHVASGSKNFRARVILATVCDPSGVKLFGKDDLSLVANMPASIIDPLVKEAVSLNKMSGDDIEDFRKN